MADDEPDPEPGRAPTDREAAPITHASKKWVPSQGELGTVAGVGGLSAAAGGLGALLDSADAMWILLLVLGGLGVILAGVSAIARRYYVESLLRIGLSDIELGRKDLINTTVARLTEAGAQREADLLLRLKSELGTR